MLFLRLSSKFLMLSFDSQHDKRPSGYEQYTAGVYPAIMFIHGKKIIIRRQVGCIKRYIYPANFVGNQNNATFLLRTYTV